MTAAEKHARGLLLAILGPKRAKLLDEPGMKDTPRRMVKALRELTDGYEQRVEMTTFPAEAVGRANPIVVVRDMAFSSLCEHHVLPFAGSVSVAYIPHSKIIGLSKIPRIVRKHARRLQVQERLTMSIAAELEPLNPLGVAVLVRGVHTCCSMRGAETEAPMVTSVVRGVFVDDARARSEVMALLGAAR